jgi:hypothetical protein
LESIFGLLKSLKIRAHDGCDFGIGSIFIEKKSIGEHRHEAVGFILVYGYISATFYTYPRKVLTYIEHRAVSGVFRTIDPPPPLQPASLSSPRTLAPGGEGVGGQYFGRRQILDWPLAV